MKNLILLLIVPFLIFSQNIPSTLISETIKLDDAQSFDFSQKISDLLNTPNQNLVTESQLNNLKNSALLRTFSTEINNAGDFGKYVNRIQVGRYLGYWNTLTENRYGNQITDYLYAFPNGSYGIEWDKVKGFGFLYKKVFDNRTARKILFDIALDVVVYWCNNLPKDFTTHLINSIEELKQFTLSIEKDDWIHPKDPDYWKGFILRRIENNNVSTQEVQKLLNIASNKLKSIDISKQPDGLYKLTINNNIAVIVYKSYYTLYHLDTGREVKMEYNNNLKNIIYFNDKKNEYYVFDINKNKEEFRLIYDSKLNIIE